MARLRPQSSLADKSNLCEELIETGITSLIKTRQLEPADQGVFVVVSFHLSFFHSQILYHWFTPCSTVLFGGCSSLAEKGEKLSGKKRWNWVV